MKRNLKNIIMISIIILIGVAVCFTLNMKSNNMPSMGTLPTMPGGSENNQNGDIFGKMPEKPGESDNEMFDRISPPSMPDEDSKETPPEKPSGDMAPPDMQGGNTIPEMPSNSSSTTKYILLGVESLVIVTLLVYLVMSNFNKKTFKETYQEKRKIFLNIISIILLAGGLTYYVRLLLRVIVLVVYQIILAVIHHQMSFIVLVKK